MTPKSLFRLAIQLCGLYLMYWSILKLVSIGVYLLVEGTTQLPVNSWVIFTEIAIIVAPLVIGVVLIFTAKKIASWFVRDADNEPMKVEKEDIIEVVTVIVGIILIVTTIPNTGVAVQQLRAGFGSPVLIVLFIRIIVGAILIWKARVISQYIMKINAVGKSELTKL